MSVGVILYSTGGQIAAPLDDTYIHLQYARQLAAGHFFAFNTEDGYSSGATSFLYVLVLGLFARLGAQGDGLLWAAHGLNVALFAASAWLSYRLGWLVRNRAVAWLSAALFLLAAHLVWGFATAMETGLTCALVLLNLWLLGEAGWAPRGAAAPGRGRSLALAVALTALAWVRPEGLALVWLAALVGAWRAAGAPARRAPHARAAAGRRRARPDCRSCSTGPSPAAPRPTPRSPRARLYQQPQFELLDFLRNWIGVYASYFTGVFTAAGATATFIPFALLFVMLGGLPAAWREIGRRRPGLFTLAAVWFLGGVLVSALLQPTLRGRYQMPFYGVFIFLTAVGLYDVVRALIGPAPAAARRVRAALWAVGGFGAIMLAGNVIMLWTALGENTMDIYNQHVQMGRWIARNLPPDARLALNDIGAMKYYGDRYVYDLIGLGTNATAGTRQAGDGATFEWLRHLPPDRRPDYFIIHRGWFPDLAPLPGFLTPIYSITLPHGTIVEPLLAVYTPDWTVIAGSDTPALGPPADPGEAPGPAPLTSAGPARRRQRLPRPHPRGASRADARSALAACAAQPCRAST